MISQVTTPETFEFDAVDDVVADVAAGKIVIVTDDADRENEGDLVMAAEKATAEVSELHGQAWSRPDLRAHFERARGTAGSAAHGRAKSRNVFDRLHRLSRCRGRRDHRHQRARSRREQSKSSPIPTPSRMISCNPAMSFRLRAKDGGVLRRAGHTEAAVDLATMAGLQPAGVLCEILHDDGTMARLPELMGSAKNTASAFARFRV